MQIDEFLQEICELAETGALVSGVLSRPPKKVRAKAARLDFRPVVVSDALCLQLAWTEDQKEQHRNLPLEEVRPAFAEMLGPVYRECYLRTTSADISAFVRGNGDTVRRRSDPAQRAAVELGHNRRKTHLIPDGIPCDFLSAIGVMTESGKVRSSRQAKFRQINRYLEIVSDVVDQFAADRTLRIIDFGCGKSYLTFALHHLLTSICGRTVDIVGLDRKAEVIADCQQIADQLGCEGLRFEAGEISSYSNQGAVDLVVSLHACDTATDDAITQAVEWKSQVILAVPCCQHEWSQRIECDQLSTILDHGILKERLAALATDAYRAAWLEQYGYATSVMEFIDLEHTPKNLLIRAVRRSSISEPATESKKLDEFKRFMGVGEVHLDSILDATRKAN